MLISFSLLGIILISSFLVLNRIKISKNYIKIYETTTIEVVKKAQFLSLTNSENSEWGVKFKNNDVILFKGSSYLNREKDSDVIYKTNDWVKFEGLDEIVFEKLTGKPNAVGNILLTSSLETAVLTVNENGNIAN